MTAADYAAACERAAAVLDAHAENEARTSRGPKMVQDVALIRTLAAALREGQYGMGLLRLTHRDELVITLPTEPGAPEPKPPLPDEARAFTRERFRFDPKEPGA